MANTTATHAPAPPHTAAGTTTASKPATPTAKIADGLEKFRTRVEHTLDADALAMLSAAITELRAL